MSVSAIPFCVLSAVSFSGNASSYANFINSICEFLYPATHRVEGCCQFVASYNVCDRQNNNTKNICKYTHIPDQHLQPIVV